MIDRSFDWGSSKPFSVGWWAESDGTTAPNGKTYPRGSLSKDGETGMDICAYAAHMAALLGAHIIKVKLPTAFVEQPEAKKIYEQQKTDIATLPARVAQVVKVGKLGHALV